MSRDSGPATHAGLGHDGAERNGAPRERADARPAPRSTAPTTMTAAAQRCKDVAAQLQEQQAQVLAATRDHEQLEVQIAAWRQLCAQARGAIVAAHDASDGASLAQAEALLQEAATVERLLEWQVPEAAELARLSVEEELLAALPPEAPMPDAHHGMARLETATMQVLTELSTVDTLQLQRRLRRGDRADELVRRFRRFGEARQQRLLERLGSKKRAAAMRAREAAARHRSDDVAAPAPAQAADRQVEAPARAARAAEAAAAPSPTPAAQRADAGHAASAPATAAAPAAAGAGASASDVAWVYVRANEAAIVDTIQGNLAGLALRPHPEGDLALAEAAGHLHRALAETMAGQPLWTQLPELLYPTDPWEIVNRFRSVTGEVHGEAAGPLTWSPEVGQMLAVAFLRALDTSLARMLPRYRVQRKQKGKAAVQVEDLVPSHPMDRLTARLLCGAGVVGAAHAPRGPGRPGGKASDEPKIPEASLFRHGVRMPQTWTWMGERDPALWNTLRVTEPADATPEEVMAGLYLDPEAAARAYLAVPVGAGLFRIDPRVAARMAGAQEHAPKDFDAELDRDALGLADSALTEEVAAAQAGALAPGEPLHLLQLRDAVGESHRQLRAAQALLAPWRMETTVAPALRWTETLGEHLMQLPDRRLRNLAKAALGQTQLLFEAVGGLRDFTAGVRPESDPSAAPGHGPIAEVIRRYAVAIGESHLVQSGFAQLAAARQAEAHLPLALLDRSLSAGKQALREAQAADRGGNAPTDADDPQAARLAAEERRLVGLHTKVAAGGEVAPGEVELLAAELAETSFETGALGLSRQLLSLHGNLVEAGAGFVEMCVAAMNPGFGAMAPKLLSLQRAIEVEVLAEVRGARAPKPEADARARAAHLQQVVRSAQARLEALKEQYQLKEFLSFVVDKLSDQQRATAIVKTALTIAAMIGVSVVAGFAGQLVGAAVRGQLLADAAAASMLRVGVAEVLSTGSGMVVDAAINAAGASVITGESGGDAFLTNLLSAGAIRATLGPLHEVAAAWNVSALEEKTMSLWARSGRGAGIVVAKGAMITAEMITSAAVSYVVHRVRHGEAPAPETAQQWALQGASMAIGAWVGHSVRGLQTRAAQALEAAPHLKRRVERLGVLAEQVKSTGDNEAAMQVMIERHQVLLEEQHLIASGHFDGRLPASTIATLRAGNAQELHGVSAQALETLPLRLGGLSPDDSSGRVWAGTSEDITIALHQATQVGLEVHVLSRDAADTPSARPSEDVERASGEAARVWRVALGQRELTIRELPRRGRTRPAAAGDHVDAEVARRATRYAEAARALRPQVEALTRGQVEAGPDFATELLQIGHAFAGVMNQDTRVAPGAVGDPQTHLIVYAADGAMTGRGEFPSGQAPDLQPMPGVRTREHTTDQAAFTTSQKLSDATEVGRWEMQTPAYRAQVQRLERRPAAVSADWTHPDKRLRVQVSGADGQARWIYCNHLDNAGGMGPADYSTVEKAVRKAVGDEHGAAVFAALRASGRVLGGSDPDISSKLHAGERVLVLGGSPTGAWAGEDAARHGAVTTIVGENRPAGDNNAVQGEAALRQLLRQGDPEQIAAFLTRRTAETHGGSQLRRNRQPGTAYGPADQRPPNLTVELGVPTQVRQAPDGRVEVTFGVGEAKARADVAAAGHSVQGEAATVRIYDRVIVAYGQDPGAPGGPAALLGERAPADTRLPDGTVVHHEVPEGTIALRMILESKDGSLVGLESLDGTVRLLGAAYASPLLAPWVVAAERDAFVAKVKAPTQVTHTGETISSDSPKSGAVIEVQRDKLPVANEVLAARTYRLAEASAGASAEASAGASAGSLRLPAAHPEQWGAELERFLTRGMHAGAGRVKAQLVSQGRDGVHTFRIWNGAEDVGLLRVYDSMAVAELDAQVRVQLAQLVPTLEPEVGRGAVALERGGVAELTSHGAEADARQGKTVEALVEQWAAMPEGDAVQRAAKRAMFQNTVGAAVRRAAETLGTLHSRFASGETMSDGAKQQQIAAVYAELASPQVAQALGGPAEVARVRAALAPLEAGFRAARLPRTAELGDASARALRFQDYKVDEVATREAQREDPRAKVMMFGKLSAEDVASVRATLDPATQKGTGSGAADVADFLASLRANPKLAGKMDLVEEQFFEAYQKASQASKVDVAIGSRWYEVAASVKRAADGDVSALTAFLQIGTEHP